MSKNKLYKNVTMASLFDDLDDIERYEYASTPPHYSEITKKQIELYTMLGVKPPNVSI
jgi:hypothetical protein